MTVILAGFFLADGGVRVDVIQLLIRRGRFPLPCPVRVGDGAPLALGVCPRPSRAALLWFRPGVVDSRSPGPPPGWLRLSRLGRVRWCWGPGGGHLAGGDESLVISVCPPNDVASLGVVVWGLGLRLLDGWGGLAVLPCLWVYLRSVRPYPRMCTPCGAWAIPPTRWRVWRVRVWPRCSWGKFPRISSVLCCQVCAWWLGAG